MGTRERSGRYWKFTRSLASRSGAYPAIIRGWLLLPVSLNSHSRSTDANHQHTALSTDRFIVDIYTQNCIGP